MTTRWALFDYDDVLVDYLGGVAPFASSRLGRDLIGLPRSWNLAEWMGGTPDEALDVITAFNEQSCAFGNLRAKDGAVDILTAVRGFGYETAVITSSSVAPLSVARRALNCDALFGGLVSRLHIVPLGETKEHVLRSYPEGSLWFEDNPRNAIIGAEAGHRAFLVDMPNNEDFEAPPPVTRVRDLREALRIIAADEPSPSFS